MFIWKEHLSFLQFNAVSKEMGLQILGLSTKYLDCQNKEFFFYCKKGKNKKDNIMIVLKKYVKAVYCHPAYLTYMQSTSWEMLGWKKHKLKSRLPESRNINNLRYADDTPLWQKVKN